MNEAEQRWHDMQMDAAVQISDAVGIEAPEIELEEIAIRVEMDEPLKSLMASIRQAASELEGQGEKSDRIAEQLLGALGKFCLETGMP